MKSKRYYHHLLKAMAFTILLTTLFSFTNRFGGDVYQIYLNDKLLLKQLVIHPIEMKSLSLENAKPADRLVIHYSHCGTIGKSRSLKLQNANGVTIKAWKFHDSKNSAMTIPVKEILDIKNSEDLKLVYTSAEMPAGMMLTSLKPSKGSLALRK